MLGEGGSFKLRCDPAGVGHWELKESFGARIARLDRD